MSELTGAVLAIKYVPVKQVMLWDRNPKNHDLPGIVEAIKRHGFRDAPIFDGTLGGIVAGNGRAKALHMMREQGDGLPLGIATDVKGDWFIPVQFGIDAPSRLAAEEFGIDHNNLVLAGGDFTDTDFLKLWDERGYKAVLADLAASNHFAVTVGEDALGELLSGFGEFELPGASSSVNSDDPPEASPEGLTLAERFGAPPFTVLDARQGYWQARKNAWLALGLRSDEGRDKMQASMVSAYRVKMSAQTGGRLKPDDVTDIPTWVGTSIFDPVLCELLYRWFAPPGARVLDPFAGGSVRGVVASYLGLEYAGLDLSTRQVGANREVWQCLAVRPDFAGKTAPVWVEGDSAEAPALAPGEYDFILSCPPYANLERYSDDPRDLSTMSYPDFIDAYCTIVARSAAMLLPDRFAAFVVGEVRGKDGTYLNFEGDTVRAFLDAGLTFYNEAAFVTQASTAAVRAPRQFGASRKLVKTHQNVLVFVKGDPRRAVAALGEVSGVELPPAPEGVQ